MPKPDKIIAQKLIGTKSDEIINSHSERDMIIYALGIGFSTDPLREQDFKYTYEIHQDFVCFPTYSVIAPKVDVISQLLISEFMPQFSPFVILHAEQKLVMVKQNIQPNIEYTHQSEIVDVVDKGKNALILFRINSYIVNEKGVKQLAFYSDMTLFLRGLGGFGFKGKGLITQIPQIPSRKPDHILKGSTYPGQAFLYRLSGDINPLHVDPNVAKGQKFQKPIIHGLASYGTVARVIVQQLLNNDQTRLKSFFSRFIGHVFPGETLLVEVWKVESGFLFLAKVEERKTKAVIGILEVKPQAKM